MKREIELPQSGKVVLTRKMNNARSWLENQGWKQLSSPDGIESLWVNNQGRTKTYIRDSTDPKVKLSHDAFDLTATALKAIERGDFDKAVYWAYLAGFQNSNSSTRHRASVAGKATREGKSKFSDEELRAAVAKEGAGAKAEAILITLNECLRKKRRKMVTLRTVQRRLKLAEKSPP